MTSEEKAIADLEKEAQEEKKNKKEKEKDKKKDKKGAKDEKDYGTFNDLAPEFQWNESMDPEHIFDKEKELINQVRKEVPQAVQETDKFILIFLFARRHEVPETVELLKNFYKLQAQYNFSSSTPPSMTYNKILKEKGLAVPMIQMKGFRDNQGRILRYFYVGQQAESKQDNLTFYTFLSFQVYYFAEVEPVNAWRNGIITIIDMTNFGLKNMDMLVVNGGGMVSAAMRLFKVLAPKKMYQRIQQYDAADLKKIIPKENLLVKYDGGASDATLEAFKNEILETEKTFYESGVS